MPRPLTAFLFAWTGGAMFVASIGYFLFSYAVTFGETAPAGSAWRDAGLNVALFSVFALHHSVFARARPRSWVARIVPPQLERSVYVWSASLMLIVVCLAWRPLPGVAWDIGSTGSVFLWLGWLTGIWLTLRSAAIIDVWDLAGIPRVTSAPTAERPTPGQGTPMAGSRLHTGATEPAEPGTDRGGESGSGRPEFRAEGPYAWVRHPIYLGWFLIVFCMSPMTMTRLVFAVVSATYVVMAIPLEERSLKATRGGAYQRYMQQVRWKLIPGLY